MNEVTEPTSEPVRSLISAHVLDASAGRPAAGIEVELADLSGQLLGSAVTDADGRVAQLGPAALPAGEYEITFGTGDYFAERGQATFYPSVLVRFAVAESEPHYHVPLLLSPFAYSTYRGS